MKIVLSCLAACVTAFAQPPNDFIVYKHTTPPPDRADQWIRPGPYNPTGSGATVAAGGFPVSATYRTFAEAAAEADRRMLDMRGFEAVCNRTWDVWVNQLGQTTACKGCVEGSTGFRKIAGPMCCPEAMSRAFPGTLQPNDCRSLPLRSVPGAGAFWNGRMFVSLTGVQIVIPFGPPNQTVVPVGTAIPPGPTGLPPPMQPAPDLSTYFPKPGGAPGNREQSTAATPPPAAGNQPSPGTWTFTVRPGGWFSTGLQLRKGQTVDITVTGSLQWPGNGAPFGPNGNLIAGGITGYVASSRVGNSARQHIGTAGTVTPDADGELQLAMPRCGPCYTNHGGEVIAFGDIDGQLQGTFTFTVRARK